MLQAVDLSCGSSRLSLSLLLFSALSSEQTVCRLLTCPGAAAASAMQQRRRWHAAPACTLLVWLVPQSPQTVCVSCWLRLIHMLPLPQQQLEQQQRWLMQQLCHPRHQHQQQCQRHPQL